MEDIEVGEYVRTDKGVICQVDKEKKNILILNFLDVEYGKIVKHSKNIIDLIEVGDFVNGFIVDGKTDEKILVRYVTNDLESPYGQKMTIPKEFIETILTKEQYANNAYTIGENK